MPTPPISVLLPVHNGERYLAAAIAGIRAQTFRDYELIVIDDGSTDRTAQILADCAAAESRLRVVTNPRNYGIPKSLNIGAQAARGEYIARHDADDCSLPARFQAQYDYLQAHPEIALVGSARYAMDAAGEINQASARLLSTHPVTDADDIAVRPAFDDLLQANHFVHGSVMLRKKVFDEAGGYDELLRNSQDYELWLRIAKRAKLANLRAPLYALRKNPESVTKRNPAASLLYTRLAVNTAQEKVTEAARADIKANGIATYYNHLTATEKIRHHKSLANTLYRNKEWQEALREYQTLKKLGDANVKMYMRMLLLLQCRRLNNPALST